MIHPTYHNGTYQHTGNRRDTHVRTPRTLSNHHRHMLEVESGISPDKIAERGYWTASTAAEIPPGFAPSQYQPGMFPILVIPQWNTVGRQAGYVLRPDHPRIDDDGRPIKYESMPGGPVGFDCPPSMVHLLRDPSVPLYITEGSKKADAMASRGLLCLSLNGVYGFLHKRVIVSELDEMETEGRRIHPAFDSDVTVKPEVADALDRLAGAMARRGARVEIVYLPAGDDGAKVGLDDFLANGGTPADLDRLTRPWKALSDAPSYEEMEAKLARVETSLATERALRRAREAQIQRMIRDHEMQLRVLQNDDLGALRVPAFGLVLDLTARINEGEQPNHAGYAMPSKRVAELVGLSEDTAMKSLRTLHQRGLIPKETIKTGKDKHDLNHIAIQPEDLPALLRGLANYRRTPDVKQHGGLRCTDHPNAGTVTRTVTMCAEQGCGKVLRDKTTRHEHRDAGAPGKMPALQKETMGPGKMPAAPLPAPTVPVSPPPGKMPLGPDLAAPYYRPASSAPMRQPGQRRPAPTAGQDAPRSPAEAWLFDTLKGGMRPVADVERAAKNAGIAPELVRAARDALNVTSCSLRGESRMYWTLPREHAV